MNGIFDPIEFKKNQLLVEQPSRFRGYGLSDGNGPKMRELQEKAVEYLKNHAANMRRQFANKVRGLIEWSVQEYERAKHVFKGDMTKYKELILYWAPERVLATLQFFKVMKTVLQDSVIWNMLDRKERHFVLKALDFAEGRR